MAFVKAITCNFDSLWLWTLDPENYSVDLMICMHFKLKYGGGNMYMFA